MQFLAGFVKELLEKAKGFDPQGPLLLISSGWCKRSRLLKPAIMSDAIDPANAAGPVCRKQTQIAKASADRLGPMIHHDILA